MVNVVEEPALTDAVVVPGVGLTEIVKLRFVAEVPKYAPMILALLVPVFRITTLI